MVIHTETIQAHPHVELSAASLVDFDRDDRENRTMSSDAGSGSRYHDAIRVQPSTEPQRDIVSKERDGSLEDESEYPINNFNRKLPNETTDADGALSDNREQVEAQARSGVNSILSCSSSEGSENLLIGGDQFSCSKTPQIGTDYDSILGFLSPSRQDP